MNSNINFVIIENTKKPINRDLVTNKGVPKLTPNGNTVQVKNPQVYFHIERTTVQVKKGFFSDTVTTIVERYAVKCFLSNQNKSATHQDVCDYINTLTPEQWAAGARTASYHYKFTVPHKFNDIYLTEIS